MTVRSSWNNTPSGLYTYSKDYSSGKAGPDIYNDLKEQAIQGRAQRWAERANRHTVIASGIYPAIISDQTYNGAAMSVERWDSPHQLRGGGEAILPIQGEISTADIFDKLHSEAQAAWEAQAGIFTLLGYTAVYNLQLFQTKTPGATAYVVV